MLVPKKEYYGFTIYSDLKLFRQSNMQSKQGLNSAKDNGRNDLNRVET